MTRFEKYLLLFLKLLLQIENGDCIVCFSKKSIYYTTKKLDEYGIKPAVIYGDLPPSTKLGQAAKFNDPEDPCNVLVMITIFSLNHWNFSVIVNAYFYFLFETLGDKPGHDELIRNFSGGNRRDWNGLESEHSSDNFQFVGEAD